jgi:hypothetical protein
MGEASIETSSIGKENVSTLLGYQGSHVRKDSEGNRRSPPCLKVVPINLTVKRDSDKKVADGAVLPMSGRTE